MATEDLTPWLNRVKQAKSRAEVFAILDEFRKVGFADDQCAKMAKLYIRLLDNLASGNEEEVKAPAAAVAQNDGPVWYEKM